MAVYKTTGTSMPACNTAPDGSGTNVTAGTGDDVVIGSLASGNQNYTNPSGGSAFRSWELSAAYTPSTFTTVPSGGTNGASTRLSVTVAAGKTLNIQPYLQTNTSLTTAFTMNIGSGGFLNTNIVSGTAGSGTVYVDGGGTLRTGDSAQGSTFESYTGASYVIRGGSTVIVGSGSGNNTLGTTSLTFEVGGGTLRFDASRTINFTSGIAINAAATISSSTTATASTNTNISGSSTLTIGGSAGLLTLSMTGASTAISCPLVINAYGSLSLTTASTNLTSSTLSGTGSIAFSGGTLGPVNATGYSGTISGTVSIAGSRTSSINVFSNNFSGAVSIASTSSALFSGNSSGYISAIAAGAEAIVTGTFSGTGGNIALANSASLTLSGSTASVANPTIVFSGGVLSLSAGASCSINSTSGADATSPAFEAVSSANVPCTYSGNLTATSATGGQINYRAFTNNILVLTGIHSSAAAKPFALNSSAVYPGTIVVGGNTGSGLYGATASLGYGKLSVTGLGNKSVGSALSAASGTTVAYSVRASQFLTSLTLQAGSTFKFATAL